MLTVYIVLVVLVDVILALHTINYTHHRFEELCSSNVSKVLYKIDTMPRIFSLHSDSIKTLPHLYCHMDLYLPSDKYGLSVHIKEMKLSGSYQNCTEDFLQFGRDVLFITTHLSEKVCGTISSLEMQPSQPAPAAAGLGQASDTATSSGLGQTSKLYHHQDNYTHRNYQEESDTEMDIWVYMTKSKSSNSNKFFTILLTPYRKICDPQDHFYRACEKKNRRCVRTELWCDGQPNCPISSENTYPDEVDCPRAQPPQMKQESKTEDNNHLFAIIFIIIFSTFVCVSAIGGLIYIRKKQERSMAAGENKTDAISVDKTLRTNGGELTLDASSHSQVRLGRSYQDVLYEGMV